MAIVLALLEIQIEGAHGWAKNLPSWRAEKNGIWSRVFQKFFFGKEMTGYHLMMFLFVILLFHLPYVFGAPFTFLGWSKIVSYLFFFFVIWDFLWFILNPHYPLKNFKREYIDWHKKWIFGLPIDYISGIFLSFFVLIPSVFFFGRWDIIAWWFKNFLFFSLEIFIIIVFTLRILKIDSWRK